MNNKTKTRKIARSKEEKDKQFQRILDKGRELFVSLGTDGLNTRTLAKHLKMSQGNLYTYVKSKRELWIAIRREDFKKFKEEMEQVVEDHKGSYFSLLEELILFFFEFSRTEPRRFKMMFVIPAPSSKIVGPIEKNYEVINPLDVVRNVVQKAIEAKELKVDNVENFIYFYYAIAYGAAHVMRDLPKDDNIMEPINMSSNYDSVESFKNYVIEQMRILCKV